MGSTILCNSTIHFGFAYLCKKALKITTNLNTLLLKNFTDNFKSKTGQGCNRRIVVLINLQIYYCCNYFS